MSVPVVTRDIDGLQNDPEKGYYDEVNCFTPFELGRAFVTILSSTR